MATGTKKLKPIQDKLENIRQAAHQLEERFEPLLAAVHPKNHPSALNLLHYIALRRHNLEPLQRQLSRLGISSLQHAESHVMANLQVVMHQLTDTKVSEQKTEPFSIPKGKNLVAQHRRAIFGKDPKGRKTHIMVTLPTEAAKDDTLIREMMQAGMDCARINCAKDDEKVWKRMIDHIRQATQELDLPCQVLMDLGGPKIRTGAIKKGPHVIKVKPFHGLKGETVKPATLRFATKFKKKSDREVVLPVNKDWLAQVKKGDIITFRDMRKHKRTVEVHKVNRKGAVADLDKVAFIDADTKLTLQRKDKKIATTRLKKIPPAKQYILLRKGDLLYLHKDNRLGEPPVYNDAGEVTEPGHIGCSLPEIFEDVVSGDPVMFDDGKIKGEITEVSPDQLTIQITYAKGETRALKPGKGINLPQSNLKISGLTSKDLRDLDFVAAHADIVNLSFVRDPQDIQEFLQALSDRKADNVGIMLKIETQRAVSHLPWLMLHAMQHYPLGIMLARGDLAIETGWEEMSVLQDEILWLCQAAHLPVVWATQVLEGMAKKGLPKRAEITDAAIAHQADCVMLNKGDYIVETIQMLDDILQKMEKQGMKSSRLVQELNFEDAFVKE